MFVVTAICGLILLYRKTGLYERNGEFRQAMQHLHNFEIVAPYVGTIVAGLMLAMAFTGVALFWQPYARKRKSHK
jgi:uncharacterized iron-regulated membrane protein